jgi:pimeloyl-ACP methyl ester carboxylesterase
MTTFAIIAMACLTVGTPQEPELELEPVEIEAGEFIFQADVGRLRVPENRSDPDSRDIEVAVAILRSTSEEPGPPLLFLSGGPGNAATPLARSPTWSRFLELGDVILLDQRGVGEARPALVWETDVIQPGLLFGDRETALAHMVEVGERAAAHYAEQGIDIASFNTVESAEDVEDLRLALGEDQLRLMGHSYGTHLGLAILRRHGETIERFVSIGSAGTGDMHKLPSELDQSLRELSALVEADPQWAERFPDFYAAVEGVLDAVAEEPLSLTVRDPRTEESVDVALGRFGLQLVLLADLGDTNDLAAFPLLVASIEDGETEIVTWFVQKRFNGFARVPVLTFVNRGASGATAARWKRIAKEAAVSPFGSTRTLFSPEIDVALGSADLGDAFRSPVKSDVPTLFISGTLDAHTPPHQAERIRAGLPHSGHLVVEYAGHDDLMRLPEVQQRILDFLAAGKPADERLTSPPLRFLAPGAHQGHPAVEPDVD